MKNKLIALLTMSALAVGTLAGCGNTAATDTAASAADTVAETPVEAVSTAAAEATEAADTAADSADKYADLSGSVSMSGSTSMEKLANAVAESFMEKYPNVTVTAEFTGSSAGIESVLAGSVDIGNSSRNLKDDEKSAGAAENIVAIDGIAVVADPANKVEDLTKDQLVSIYTGETKNWSEVACVYANELDSTGAVMAKVASTPGAIGYVSLDVVDDSVKALKLDGVDATEENIKAGNYALSRPFVMATKGEISEQKTEVQALFDYLSSDEGKALIKSVGLITVD